LKKQSLSLPSTVKYDMSVDDLFVMVRRLMFIFSNYILRYFFQFDFYLTTWKLTVFLSTPKYQIFLLLQIFFAPNNIFLTRPAIKTTKVLRRPNPYCYFDIIIFMVVCVFFASTKLQIRSYFMPHTLLVINQCRALMFHQYWWNIKVFKFLSLSKNVIFIRFLQVYQDVI
jgi:hypothetical protein